MKSSARVVRRRQSRAVEAKRPVRPAPTQIGALLTYLAPTDEKPFAHTYEPGNGVRRRSGEDAPHQVTIRNARFGVEDFSIDRQGFELIAFPTLAVDFDDHDQIRLLYYPEVERRLKALMGATRVIIASHTLRSSSRATPGKTGVQEPVQRVHNDYTSNSAVQRVRDLLPDEAETLITSRFAAVNVWRPIHKPVKRFPLALCDARSVQTKDLVANDLIFRGRVTETYKVTYNSSHRWYYFSDMQLDEAIAIKCYDSDTSRAQVTPHAAFHDPTTPMGSPPRESVEVRAFAFFRSENPCSPVIVNDS